MAYQNQGMCKAKEQAAALGFSSVEQMREHQTWLKDGAERQARAKEAVADANSAGSNAIDARGVF